MPMRFSMHRWEPAEGNGNRLIALERKSQVKSFLQVDGSYCLIHSQALADGGFVSKKTQEITLILEIALVQNPPNNYENTLNL